MPQQPTLLDVIDWVSRLKNRLVFLSFALHSSRLNDGLDPEEIDGVCWFVSDFCDEFDRLESELTAVLKGGNRS